MAAQLTLPIILVVLVALANAALYRGLTDTKDGFCHVKGHDIKVGEAYAGKGKGPHDPNCQRISCSKQGYEGATCGTSSYAYDKSKCHLEDVEGTYPDCCKQNVKCD